MPYKFFPFFALLFLVSCQSNLIYEKKQDIPNGVWTYENALDFEFEISDTSGVYTLYLDFDHGSDYPTQNLYTQLVTTFPQGDTIQRMISFNLFDNTGTPNGKCSAEACRVRMILQENAYFSQAGTYQLNVAQHMRRDSLEGISAVGLAVEKTGER